MRKVEKGDNIWYTLISFVRISKTRQNILKNLKKRPCFPSELVRYLNTSFSNVSKNLKKLREKDLVICYSPNQKKGKLYALSEKGNLVFEILEQEFNNTLG